MRVTLRFPATWQVETGRDFTIATSPDDQLRIEVSPLMSPAGFDPRTLLERGVPPSLRVDYVQLLDNLATEDGWPMKLATLRILHGDVVRELRLGAIYEMVTHLAVAVARARGPVQYEAARPELLAVLASARPHLWGGEPVCVDEYWMPEDP